MEEIIYHIEAAKTHGERLKWLDALEQRLRESTSAAERKFVISLLYHRDWYIRREVAFLVDRYGISLSEQERLQFAFALQNFAYLTVRINEPAARELLFNACLDPAPKIRAGVVAHITQEDCLTVGEEVRLHYAASDYQTLIELGCSERYREAVVDVLMQGMHQEDNPAYHRRQCAFCLEQLKAVDDAQSVIANLLQDVEATAPAAPSEKTVPPHLSKLDFLLHTLRQQGPLLDGKQVYPTVEVGAVTGRITYKNPPLQTLPPAERYRRLQPSAGHRFLISDYVAMEPTVLMHFLVSEFLLSLTDLPAEDIYLAIDPTDRQAGKAWLNAVINGAGRRYRKRLNRFQEKMWEAIQEFRQELFRNSQENGYVETIAGRHIPLPENEPNRLGKIMNRLIQGSAADLFNTAVAELQLRFVEELLPARVSFVLFDEVWIEVANEAFETIAAIAIEALQTIPRRMGLQVALHVRVKPIPETHHPGQEPKGGD